MTIVAGTASRTASPQAEWRRRPPKSRMAVDEARRQGDISTFAFLTFGKERAIAFLNADNASLGGRPIYLATASAEGAAKVADEIRRLAAA